MRSSVRSFSRAFRQLAASALPLLLWAHASGAIADTVRIGLSVPLSGVQAGIGKEAQTVWRAVAREFNGTPSLRGHTLEVVVMDDAFEAGRSKANAEAMAAQGVVVMAAASGIPTVQAMVPMLERTRTPLLGPASGSLALRGKSPAVFHVKASFGAEVDRMAQLLGIMGLKRVTVVVDDVADRQPLLERFSARLQRASGGSSVVASVVLPQKGGNAVKAAAAALAGHPDAVYVLTIPGMAGPVLKNLRGQGYKGFVAAGSMAATDSVVREVGAAGVGVIFGAVVPSPTSARPGIQAAFQAFARKHDIQPSFRAIEIYITGRILVEALSRLDPGAAVTGSRIWSALESLSGTSLDGWRVTFSPTDREGSNYVDTVMLMADGRFR